MKDQLFKDSLLKNSIYLMMTNFITSITGFFFWIIAARYYSADDIGMTSAIFSGISLISMISSLGLSRALIFYLPREKNANKIINSCLMINIISSIVFSLVFVLGLNIWAPPLENALNNMQNITIFIGITTAISVSSLIGAAFTAGKRSSFQLIKEFIYHSVKILPLIILVEFGTLGILLSLGIGLLLSTTMGFILLFKVWKYIPRLTLDPIIKSMANFSAQNYIADIFYNLPKLILPIMILNMISAQSAGFFYIAIMMAGLLYGVSQSVSSSLLAESSDENKFWHNVNKSIRFNLIFLIPGLLLFTVFGKFILNIFNPSYAENATTTMIILAISSIPLSLVNIFNTVRNTQKRVFSMIKMNVTVAGISIILSVQLIKIMDIEGVAISYLVANTIGALFVINRVKNPKEFTIKLLRDVKKIVSEFAEGRISI